MADTFSKEKRSGIMACVKGRNTKPEVQVRSLLHGMGYRFRLHRADLPGKPDIVLPKYGKVIFVHGCFWHGHDCKRAARPTSNVGFWNQKIDGNIARDRRACEDLRKAGWKFLVLWQCQLKDKEALSERLNRFLRPDMYPGL